GLAGDVHHDEDRGGVGVPVDRTVSDEGGARRVAEIGGDSVAAGQSDASDGKHRTDQTCPHGSSSRLMRCRYLHGRMQRVKRLLHGGPLLATKLERLEYDAHTRSKSDNGTRDRLTATILRWPWRHTRNHSPKMVIMCDTHISAIDAE